MKKNIEVEIRGLLGCDEYKKIKQFFDKNAQFIESKNRILIDYSTCNEKIDMENRTEDIRIRSTNGVPEIIVKLGGWGGAEARREISLKIGEGSFDDLVEVFGHLGWKEGMLCIRKSLVYKYKEIEFALVEVPGHSYYFEAEKMVSKEAEKEKSIQEISQICQELGLSQFSKKDFFDYIKILNSTVNEKFDFNKYSKDYFKKRFSL